MHRDSLRWLFLALLPAAHLSVSRLSAQQFVQQVGLLPGALKWTEAVLPVDANADGRWDALLVCCNGWSVPGDLSAPSSNPLPQTLLVNQATVGGNPVFADQTAMYLPANLVVHGKSAASGDADGDGDADLAFAIGFQARQRLLLKNGPTGAWNDAAAQFPSLVMNGFGVRFGDLDADGDLDLVFADAGPSTFFAPGGKARLLINGGSANYVEQPTWLNAVDKVGAQNVHVVDIDNDWDLDVLVDGKSAQTHLYRNDGSAHFALELDTVPAGVAGATQGCYETDWADLDGDDDIDSLVMSYPGTNLSFSDAAARNRLAEDGVVSFDISTSYLGGANGHDDNDFAFVDADDDGDLDVIDATLGNIEEKLYLNAGVFGPDFLHFTSGAGFSFVSDDTLDIALADFDGDGDCDALTGQGENGSFQHRYYRNAGPSDTHAPRIGRVQATAATIELAAFTGGAGPLRRAWAQDGAWDDNLTFASAGLDATIGTDTRSSPMPHVGGQLFQGPLALPGAATSWLGADVTWQVVARDPNGNTASSAPQAFRVCGWQAAAATPGNPLALAATGTPTLGSIATLSVSGADPSSYGLVAASSALSSVPLFGGTLLVDLAGAVTFGFQCDAQGNAALAPQLPVDPALQGARLYLQAGALGLGGIALSNRLDLCLCGN